jgi:hypothetical protein
MKEELRRRKVWRKGRMSGDRKEDEGRGKGGRNISSS